MIVVAVPNQCSDVRTFRLSRKKHERQHDIRLEHESCFCRQVAQSVVEACHAKTKARPKCFCCLLFPFEEVETGWFL